MKNVNIRIKFLEEMLGTSPADPEVYRKFIGSKSPDAASVEEEVEALGVDAVIEKGRTVFPKDKDGDPVILDYQVKGFCKAAWQALNKIGSKKPTESSKLKAGLSKIDRTLHVYPRFIKIENAGEIQNCERPLRANTAQGPRVSLASSDMIREGAEAAFTVKLLDDNMEKALREWMAYGQYSGLGQWRNSGKGRFEVLSYEVEEAELFPELG